jgi:ATP-dependent DNA helicase RecG
LIPTTKAVAAMNRDYDTIEELLTAPEGENFEFKEAKRNFDSTEAARYLCAMSNRGGGKLIFGITDERPRRVVGSKAFAQPERTRSGLIGKLKVDVTFQLLGDGTDERVLVFTVAPHPVGLPVQVDGTAWWRIGDSFVPMPEDVRRAIYAESGHDFSGDVCPGATLQDLDKAAIDIFRNSWAAKSGSDGKRIKNLPDEQLLRDCEAFADNGVTFAALILFGTHAALGKYLPLSEIVFEYRHNEASGPADVRENIRVGFFACFDRVWELINLRNTKQSYQDGLFLLDILTFNERVIREALLNAVSHRNYQTEGSIFVIQYPNKLVIDSPGGFPSGINAANILNKQKPRNRRIAEIFARCGLVERAGQGMNLIYEYCVKEAKALPDFAGTDDYNVRITLDGLVLDKRMLTLINRIGAERLESLTTDDFLVIDALFYERKLSNELRARIKRLVEIGIIEHAGKGKYILARGLYEATGKSGIHTRLSGLDRNTNKTLLLEQIKRSGSKGSKQEEFEQVLPSHSRRQVQSLIAELKDDGRIFSTGKTSATRWYLTESEDSDEK